MMKMLGIKPQRKEAWHEGDYWISNFGKLGSDSGMKRLRWTTTADNLCERRTLFDNECKTDNESPVNRENKLLHAKERKRYVSFVTEIKQQNI